MAVTGSFYTALTGLNANSRAIDVVGNNIANVNTPGFKASQALFATQFLENLSAGSPPDGQTTGGTNPLQVGLGTRFAGVQTNFNNGGIRSTGFNTNMAIEGNGFFIVDQGDGQFYTRDGQFSLNNQNDLATESGAMVQGYGVDQNFNVATGALGNLNIPLGSLTTAEATSEVNLEGNLNASGSISTGGSQHTSRTFYTDALLTAGNESTGAEDLTVAGNDLYISDGAGGSFLALEGGTDTIITVNGVEKGGKALAAHTFAFTDAATAATLGVDDYGSTLQDFVDFINDTFGLSSTVVNGQTLGGGASLSGGQLTITGNEGTSQDLAINTVDFAASNIVSGISQPFVMSKVRSADGESTRTNFTVYDSLGTPASVDLTMVKQANVAGGGTIWEFVAESNDTASISRILGLGTLQFDANGQFVSASNDSVSMTRDNGASSPLTFSLTFDNNTSAITALSDSSSEIAAISQNGSAIGFLNNFSVGEDGVLTGTFSNGLSRTIGQVALATFVNNQGLVALGNNLYTTGPNSGNAIIGTPQQFSAGRIVAGALEQSNVDLAEEFVNLITASSAFSASSRVITTADQLIQQLLAAGR
ncbi:MAG: flagellar hook protein FlgE [Phycisphaerales bacterium]